MSFYDRYAECCKHKGISPVSQDAADQLGCTRGTISAFAKNGTTPKGEFVAGAASMLDVSADYLLGLTDTPQPIHESLDLSPIEKQALQYLRAMNDEGLDAAIAMLSGLASQEIYKRDRSSELAAQKEA